ncbi:MAG: EamA family transporter [Myxococcales bacterium]
MSSTAYEVESLCGESPSLAQAAAPRRWPIAAAFAVIYLVWGSTFLGIRVAVETLPPLTMSGFRFLVAGTVLLLFTSRVRPRPTLREWRNAVIVGALFFLGNHGLISNAARFLPSSVVCLIISTEVAIIAVLSSLFLGQPLTRAGLAGAALGFAGVLCLFGGQGVGGSTSLLASFAVLGASISWSFGAVLSQRLRFPPDAVLRAGMQMTCGGVLLTIASALRGEMSAVEFSAFSHRSLFALGYLILFGSVLAFACYSYLLKHVRTDAVATHVFVNPLVAVAVGAWLGGEQLQAVHFVSGGLILASVLVILLGQRRKRPVAAQRAVAIVAAERAVAAD